MKNTNNYNNSTNERNTAEHGNTEILCFSGVIRNCIQDIRLELAKGKKKLSLADDTLEQIITGTIKSKCIISSDNKTFKRQCLEITREQMWFYANKEESEPIINRLKSGDKEFAIEFFYGSDINGCNISRLRSNIIAKIKNRYHEEVSVKEFGDVLYALLWNNGTWKILDKFKCRSSFFHWLSKVAENEIVRLIEKTACHNTYGMRTARNTHLLGKSVPADKWKDIIYNLMPKGKYRTLLEATYIKQMDEEQIMSAMGVDGMEMRKMRKKAEIVLKEILINNDDDYTRLVLRDNKPCRIKLSEDEITDPIISNKTKEYINPLSEVLGINLNKSELHDEVINFLYAFSSKLDWDIKDKTLWQLRFIENVPSLEVARRFGQKRSWVDNRFHRINILFNKEIKKWWYANAC